MNVSRDFAGVSWVRLAFVDVFGTSHSMQVPASRFSSALAEGVVFDGSSLEGRARLIETDMRLRPDPATVLRISEDVARAGCNVLAADGSPWPGDPRTALAMVLDETEDLGAGYRVSAELEFYVLGADGEPVDASGYFGEAEGVGMVLVREAADALVRAGVPVDSVHHEAGPGQYEIDIAPLDALTLADAIVLAKELLRETAARAGLLVTFMPQPFEGEPGSGMHLHQRLDFPLLAEDGGLAEAARYFLAGQLAHARGLCALASPTVNSYKRLHSGPEAPGSAVWAHVNRGALVRLSPNGEDATLEFRAADPSANPYLLLAGLLAAGADGLASGLELAPAFEESDGFDPAAVDSVRAEPLPRDLDEALTALLSDDALLDAFDQQLLERLVDGRRAEAAAYRAQVTPWEIERYLEES